MMYDFHQRTTSIKASLSELMIWTKHFESYLVNKTYYRLWRYTNFLNYSNNVDKNNFAVYMGVN